MKRVELVVAYDGTNYCGWQVQPNGITIEEVLNRELSRLLQEEITVDGASRTDSGVHSLGNIAVFDTGSRIPADKLAYALNQSLPKDIRIQSSREVPSGFHPRKCNSIKTYEYNILNRAFALPTCRLYSYFYHVPLDLRVMKEGAAYLEGEHDFCAFCSSKGQAKDTVRTIYCIDVEQNQDMITIRIRGNGFLYNMVRIIAGSLIEVGRGFQKPQWIKEVLESRDRTKAGRKAPAEGLTLVSLLYDDRLQDKVASSNHLWDYVLMQREIPYKQKAYLWVNRCEDEEFLPLIERKTLQAMRNGATQVFAADKEKGSRLKAVEQLGWYQVSYRYSILFMELKLTPACEMGIIEPQICQTHSNDLQTGQYQNRGLAAVPVAAETAAAFLSIYEQCFHEIPAAGTYGQETLLEHLADNSRFTAFLKRSDEVVGFFQLSIGCDEVELDSIGILPIYAGQGLGREALAYVIANAVQMHKKKVMLTVASSNERALHLYESMGFEKKEEMSRWYCLEEVPSAKGFKAPENQEIFVDISEKRLDTPDRV